MTPSHRAFTLVEVIVGLVLMASLVTSSLVALAGHRRSIWQSQQRLRAIAVAESLLTTWYETRGHVPVRDQAWVTGGLMWRTFPVANRPVCGLAMQIVRLEIWAIEPTAGTSQRPLVSVELLHDGMLR